MHHTHQSSHPQSNQRRQNQKNPQTMRQTSSNEKPPLSANKPPTNIVAPPPISVWNTNSKPAHPSTTQHYQKPSQPKAPQHPSMQQNISNQVSTLSQANTNHPTTHQPPNQHSSTQHPSNQQTAPQQASYKPVQTPQQNQQQQQARKFQPQPQTTNATIPPISQQNSQPEKKVSQDILYSKDEVKQYKLNTTPESKPSSDTKVVSDKKNEITDVAVLLNNDNRVAIKDNNTKVAIKNTKTELVVSPVKKIVEPIETEITVSNETVSEKEKDKTANELRDFSKPVFTHPLPVAVSKPAPVPTPVPASVPTPVSGPASVPTPVHASVPVASAALPVKTKQTNTSSKPESDINKIKLIEYRNGLS